jgi:hypothetical protein
MAVVGAILFSSCNSTAKNTVNAKQRNANDSATAITAEQDIPFTMANRYFVNNTYNDGDLMNPKITTPEQFKKIFGMATVMGPNGKPTAIDFSRQYVVAVIGKLTNRNTSINMNSLKQKDNLISLAYKVTEGEKGSVTIRPALLIIVDNKYQGEIKLIESRDKN